MPKVLPHTVIEHQGWCVDGGSHTNTIEGFYNLSLFRLSIRQLAASVSERNVLLSPFLRNSSPRSSNCGHAFFRMNFTSKYSK